MDQRDDKEFRSSVCSNIIYRVSDRVHLFCFILWLSLALVGIQISLTTGGPGFPATVAVVRGRFFSPTSSAG